MHSIARENLQNYLYAYKETPKEAGLEVVHDERLSHEQRKRLEERHAISALQSVVGCRVAFAVQCHLQYDGSLEDESPYYRKTVSYEKGDFIHVYQRYSSDWWLGRVVSSGSTIGFVPTARRLARIGCTVTAGPDEGGTTKEKKPKKRLRAKQSDIWELPNAYTVVPSTRPILLLGPSRQGSRLTQLMHAAIRSEIVKRFGSRIRRLETDIGEKGHTKLDYDLNERELRVITALSEDLHLVLLDCPNIEHPSQLASLNLAPIVVLFRIRNRKILIKLLKKAGIKGGNDLAGADALNALPDAQVDLVIEDNGLAEATAKICNYLESYWKALHSETSLMEQSIVDMCI